MGLGERRSIYAHPVGAAILPPASKNAARDHTQEINTNRGLPHGKPLSLFFQEKFPSLVIVMVLTPMAEPTSTL